MAAIFSRMAAGVVRGRRARKGAFRWPSKDPLRRVAVTFTLPWPLARPGTITPSAGPEDNRGMNAPMEFAAPPEAAPIAGTGPAARTRTERETLKLEKRLCRQVGQAIADFNFPAQECRWPDRRRDFAAAWPQARSGRGTA